VDALWVQALAAIVQAGTLAVTAWIFLRQLRVMTAQTLSSARAAEGQTLIKLVEMLGAREMISARNHVIALKAPLHEWAADDRHQAELVIRSFDMTGLLVRNGMISLEIVLSTWGPRIVESWYATEAFHRQLNREHRSESYMDNFKWLAERAKERNSDPSRWKGLSPGTGEDAGQVMDGLARHKPGLPG